MHIITPTLLLSLSFPLVFTAPSNHWDHHFNRAIYTLSNDPAGSNIVAVSVAEDGTLSRPCVTSTGGRGLRTLNVGPPFGVAGTPAMDDSLQSQNAVLVAENYLFTVNAGSNTVSMFSIDSRDFLHPRLIGQPANTLGEFPQSVAYSPSLKTACVLNGGAKNGVACFRVSPTSGLQSIGPLRPLPKLKTTTPPTGPPNTASEIIFNPSSSAVFVTIKGAPPSTLGAIYAFPVHEGQVSTVPVVTSPSDIILDFSLSFLGNDHSAVVTDPAFGASILSITENLEIKEIHHIPIPGQKAVCWSVYSKHFSSAYVIDVGHPNITVLDPTTGAINGVINYDADAKGGLDSAIMRRWMYTLAVENSIIALELSGNGAKEVQKLSLDGLGPAGSWQGMAVWPSWEDGSVW